MSKPLTTEIWACVAPLLSRADLMNFALVSRVHLDISRRVFCRVITLTSNQFDFIGIGGGRESDDHRFSNYLVKYNLGPVVQELMVWGYAVKPELDRLLEMTPSLRSLSMVVFGTQCLLAGPKTQRKFVRRIQSLCPKLEEFRLNASTYLKDDHFPLQNLKAVKWKELGRVSRAFISLCRASLSTLTEISLRIDDGAYAKFFSLRFPSLLLFKIGPGSERYGRNAARAKAIASGLSSFLAGNPSIASLDLIYYPDIYVSLDPQLLAPDMLPSIKTLHAHPDHVSQLVDAGVQSLKGLDVFKLSEKPYKKVLGYDLSGMLKKLTKMGPFAVRTFVCEHLFDCSNEESVAADMKMLAEAFPELESWESSLPGKCSVDQLIELFSPFLHLKTISYDTSSRTEDPFTIEEVTTFAEKCPALQTFIWRGTKLPMEFNITHPEEGQLITKSTALRPRKWQEEPDYHPDSGADNSDIDTDYERAGDTDDEGDLGDGAILGRGADIDITYDVSDDSGSGDEEDGVFDGDD